MANKPSTQPVKRIYKGKGLFGNPKMKGTFIFRPKAQTKSAKQMKLGI